MKFREIQEACWKGYQQQGMKKKGDREVPNCVPVAEVKIGPEITGRDLLFKAAAMAMRDAGREGISLDYEQAIKQASKIYGIPYQPSELPKLLAQRAEIDRQLALLKQGKQVAKQRRQAKLAPTPAGAEEYWRTHALPTDRIKPATKTLEETEAKLAEDLKKWFKEKWVRFGPDGRIRGACARGSSKEGKPKCLPQSKAHALGKKGRASAAAKKRREDPNPERRGPAKNVATKVREQGVAESSVDNNAKLSWIAKKLASETVIPGDRKDFLKAAKRFDRGYTTGGMDIIYDMDTDPRDDFFNYCDHYGAVYEQGGAQVKRPAPRTRGEFVTPANSSDSYKAGHDLGVKLARATTMTQAAKTQMVQTQSQQQAMPADFIKGYKKGFSDVAAYIRNQQDIANAANKISKFAKFKNITPDQVQQIVARYSAGETSPQIAPDFNLDAQQILRLIDKQANRDEIIRLNRQNRKGKIGPQRQLAFDETQVREQHDWDDADEFGMPGSEFFQDDDRLRDGDYVRDRQDGESGEIFRMSGDPSERRVRILDRDGKGWYISPERLIAVDRTDPDIMRYFGKRRHRDMDEAVTLDRNKVPDYPQDSATVKHRTDTAKAILSDPKSDPDSRKQAAAIVAKLDKTGVAEGFEYGSRVQHPKYGAGQVIQVYSNGMITVNFPNYPDPIDKKPGVRSNFAPGDKDYQSLKPMVSEKQDACYRKVKSRYKVWPSAYASGALVQCRKKGAANWGNKSKK